MNHPELYKFGYIKDDGTPGYILCLDIGPADPDNPNIIFLNNGLLPNMDWKETTGPFKYSYLYIIPTKSLVPITHPAKLTWDEIESRKKRRYAPRI